MSLQSRESKLRSLSRPTGFWRAGICFFLGGYAVALFVNLLRLRDQAADFILLNQIPVDQLRAMLPVLIAGLAAAAFAWALWAIWAGSRAGPRGDDGRVCAAGLLLSLLPSGAALAAVSREGSHPWFSGGLALLMALLAWSAIRQLTSSTDRAATPVQSPARGPHSSARLTPALALAIAFAVLYFFGMAALTISRHNAFMTHSYDLGIHDQAIYNIIHSGYMRSTQYGAEAIDYIGDHFSPILYALAPVYALHPDARTLLVLQTLFLAAGAVPVYLLAQRFLGGRLLPLALAASYLLHPALHGVNTFDFHQLALVTPLLLAALYFMAQKRNVWFLVFLGLALLVKEEVALTVAAIGLYLWLADERKRLGIALLVAGAAYFVIVVGFVMPGLGGKPQIYRFSGFMAPGSSGFSGVLLTLITNPFFALYYVASSPDRLLYIGQILLPVLFLPLAAPVKTWLMALPALAIPLLSSTPAYYQLGNHYPAHLLPFVYFLTVLALARLKQRPPGELRPWVAGLIVAALASAYAFSPISPARGELLPQRTAHMDALDRVIAQAPADASVSALSDLVPHLSNRRDVYLYPTINGAEYILFDADTRANYWPYEGLKARSKAVGDLLPLLVEGKYGLVAEEDGVLLLKAGHGTGENARAIRALLSASYEAEDLSSDFANSVVEDANASGGRARAAMPDMRSADGKATLLFGPYTDLAPGNYRATFFIKTSALTRTGALSPEALALTIDVFTHKDGYPRAVREIYARDLIDAEGYQGFALEFNTSGQTLEDVEFRATYHFQQDVSIDRVGVEYLN